MAMMEVVEEEVEVEVVVVQMAWEQVQVDEPE